MTITDSQQYGGSAAEAGWHQPHGKTILIWLVKDGKRKLHWRNDEYLKDKTCPLCNLPALECPHYQIGKEFKS